MEPREEATADPCWRCRHGKSWHTREAKIPGGGIAMSGCAVLDAKTKYCRCHCYVSEAGAEVLGLRRGD